MTDPCQIFVDAVAASEAEVADLVEQLDAALTLLDERLAALADCREHNPGSGGGGGEGLAAQGGNVREVVAKVRGKVDEIKVFFKKKK